MTASLKTWTGTASELLGDLNRLTADEHGKPTEKRKRSDWPKSPGALSSQLRRLAPALRSIGIDVAFERTKERKTVTLTLGDPEEEEDRENSVTSVTASLYSGAEDDDPAENHRHESVPPSSPYYDPAEGGMSCDAMTMPSDDLFDTIVTDSYSGSDARDAGDADFAHSSSRVAVLLAANQPHTFIQSAAALAEAVRTLTLSPLIAVDTETTGLDPRKDRLRILTLSTSTTILVIDTWCCPGWQDHVRPLFADQHKTVMAHNATFDLGFLLAAGIQTDAEVFDTEIASRLIDGGIPREKGYHSLAGVVQRVLGATLDKSEQQGDWRQPELSIDQLRYAAMDAAVLLPLYDSFKDQISARGLDRVAAIEHGCVLAMVWVKAAGMPFDVEAWRLLSDNAVLEEQRCKRQTLELFAKAGANQFGGFPLKLESPKQVRLALARLGIDVEQTDEEHLAAYSDQPVVAYFLAWRDAAKRAGTYGIQFISKHVHASTGRIHAEFRQLGAASGRMSCDNPNLQNIPRQRDYRACFRPEGDRVLVKADYSAIELRLAAVIASDKALLEAFRQGADLHRRTAATVLGVPEAEVTKEQRQLAKALNFGLLYGMGAQTLVQHAATGYGVRLSLEEATQHRNRFFAAYHGLARWHRSIPRDAIDTRTLAGRLRPGVDTFTQKANTPVQGSGADGLKLALGRLWRHRHEVPADVRLVNVVHDEIVAECRVEDAPGVADWLKRHMVAAMAEIVDGKVPIEVEATIARDWAGTPIVL